MIFDVAYMNEQGVDFVVFGYRGGDPQIPCSQALLTLLVQKAAETGRLVSKAVLAFDTDGGRLRFQGSQVIANYLASSRIGYGSIPWTSRVETSRTP